MDAISAEPTLVLRVLCGLWFAPHVLGKIRNSAAASGTFEKAGFRPPRVWVWIAVAMELLAGLGLVFGLYTRVAAALAVVLLLGAACAVVRINGFNWRWQKQGPEYPLFWAAACVISVWGSP